MNNTLAPKFWSLKIVLFTKEPKFLEQMAESMFKMGTVQSLRLEGPEWKAIIN